MFVQMCVFLRATGICNFAISSQSLRNAVRDTVQFIVNSIKFNLQFLCTQPYTHTHTQTLKHMHAREFANNHGEGNGSAHVGVTIAALAIRAPNVYWLKQEKSRNGANECGTLQSNCNSCSNIGSKKSAMV